MNLEVLAGHWKKNLYIYSILLLVLCVVGVGCIIYNIALDKVTLVVDGKTIEYKTLGSNVAGIIKENGIQLGSADVVKPSLDTQVFEGIHIEILRAFPVTIKTSSKQIEYYTVESSVRDILANAQVNYDQDDRVVPDLDKVIASSQEIQVIDVTTKVITQQVKINSGVEYRKDKSLERGVQKVLQEGQDGIKERQVRIVYENGKEQKRYIIGEKIIKEKINAIIALGIKPIVRVLETSRGSYRYLEMKVMDSTAYSPGPESCGIYAKYGRTYTGKKAGFGLVAVDPRVIPLGTKLYIEGYGRAEAADIGGAIKGNRIDLCFETYREAIMYGRKKVKVYILE